LLPWGQATLPVLPFPPRHKEVKVRDKGKPLLIISPYVLGANIMAFLPGETHRDKIAMRQSTVPPESLDQVHATFMPDATQAVSKFPPGFIPESSYPPVLASSLVFRHLIIGSLLLVSLNLTCHDLLPRLFLNAHHNGS
jgi:hypothetical protein